MLVLTCLGLDQTALAAKLSFYYAFKRFFYKPAVTFPHINTHPFSFIPSLASSQLLSRGRSAILITPLILNETPDPVQSLLPTHNYTSWPTQTATAVDMAGPEAEVDTPTDLRTGTKTMEDAAMALRTPILMGKPTPNRRLAAAANVQHSLSIPAPHHS